MNSNFAKRLLEITSKTLTEVEQENIPLSRALRISARIARLRSDYENLYWILFELRTIGQSQAKMKSALEVAPHYTREDFSQLHKKTLDFYLER